MSLRGTELERPSQPVLTSLGGGEDRGGTTFQVYYYVVVVSVVVGDSINN